MKKSGFTLIELLIVVAIIAILAAIAVPNFLEAQVRSKVSRVRNDLRTIATGLESYAVDTNKYPPLLGDPSTGWGQPENSRDYYGNFRGYGFRGVPHQLTTPVKYITSILTDPFKYGASAMEGASIHKPYIDPNVFDGSYIYHNIKQYVDSGPASGFNYKDLAAYGCWRIFSLGPYKKYVSLGSVDPTMGWYYDSTNGTVSTGMIIRTQNDTVGKRFRQP